MSSAVSTTQSPDEVRTIDTGAVPTRFARGWHCLGVSESFKDGGPHSVQAFGQKLVVFADSNGALHVLDAYCRHMGGDLSQGTVKGDAVACPFHDWRWGGNGRCAGIPYGRRVPPRARTRSWPTLDQDGLFFVWNDPEGNPPLEEQAIPRIEGGLSDEWSDWVWYSVEVDTNCREVVDNVVDMAHFFYVHHAFPTKFRNVFEGHVATQYMEGLSREDVAKPALEGEPTMLGNTSLASYFGPSFMIDELVYQFDTGDIESILINCHYPVTANKFVLMYGIIVKKPAGLPDETALHQARGMGDFIKLGFEQDIEIWKSKTRIDNPLLCEEDGPVYQLRRWYEQFYVDVADVRAEMTDRFEFELDTSRPVEAWRREMEENLARRAEAGAEQAGAAAGAAG